MSARNLALTLAIALMGLGCTSIPAVADAAQRELRFTAQQLNRQLAPSFPQRRCLFGMACVDLKNPKVELHRSDQRIFVDVDLALLMGTQQMGQGSARIAGHPHYDSTKGAFFLRQPSLQSLEVPGALGTEVQMARQLINAILAEDILADQPIWVLDESDARQSLAKLTLRRIEVRDGVLVAIMGDDEDENPDESLPEDEADESAPATTGFTEPVEI